MRFIMRNGNKGYYPCLSRILMFFGIIVLTSPSLFTRSQGSDTNEAKVTFHQIIRGGQLEFNSESNDTVSGWQTIPVKNPHSKARWTIKLNKTKDGQECIQWGNTNDDYYRLHIYKANSPVNAKGEITRCKNYWKIIVIKKASILLRNLKKEYNMHPGYYAISVYDDIFKDYSNWIVIKIN